MNAQPENQYAASASYEQNYSHAEQAVQQLVQTLFVFHCYMNLSAVGPDGIMWNLDAKRLDVKNNPPVGTLHLERLHLLPITATQKPVINNKEGFSVSNMFVGSQGKNQQGANPAQGVGSGMMQSCTSNVRGEWDYPGQKIAEMIYTYGRYGLIRINSLSAYSPDEERICKDIFRAVMSGIPAGALLEDLPEYFTRREDYYVSDFLPDKKPFGFAETAYERIARVFEDGLPTNGEKNYRLPGDYYNKAVALISEIQGSVMQAHVAALDPEIGELTIARDSVNNQVTKSYDRAAQWLMRQFPSFPLDSTVEKANKQIIRALDAGGNEQSPATASPGDSISFYELYKQEQIRTQQLTERLASMEGKFEQFMSSLQAPPAPTAPTATTENQPTELPAETLATQPVAPKAKGK